MTNIKAAYVCKYSQCSEFVCNLDTLWMQLSANNVLLHKPGVVYRVNIIFILILAMRMRHGWFNYVCLRLYDLYADHHEKMRG